MRTFLTCLFFLIIAEAQAGELTYYQRFMSLLDSSGVGSMTNVTLPAVGVRADERQRSVAMGMSISEAVAALGKPRSICPGSLEHAGLSYSNGLFVFKEGRLEEILTAQGRLNELKVQSAPSHQAYNGDRPYGDQFKSVVDPRNPGPDFTKEPILLAKLRRGEMLGVKLGMTMDSVVAAWGMPKRIQGSARRPRLLFGNCSLTFAAGKLQELVLSGEFVPALRFDNGLTGQMNKGEFKKALGIPTEDRYMGSVRCESEGIVIEFRFAVHVDGARMVSSEEARMRDATLGSLSVRCHEN